MAGSTRRLELAMTAGSLAFAAGGLLTPGLFGRLAGLSPGAARLLGARDVVVAAVLATRGGPLALAARGVCDVGDAVLMARRRPPVAVFAGAMGMVSLAAAAAARRSAPDGGAAWRGLPAG